MTIEKYRRVIWRLEEIGIDGTPYIYPLRDVRKALMQEIGTDERTIENNMKRMIELKYIKRIGRWYFKLLVGSHDIN